MIKISFYRKVAWTEGIRMEVEFWLGKKSRKQTRKILESKQGFPNVYCECEDTQFVSWRGLFCALEVVEQHPWPYSLDASEIGPDVTTKNVSRCCKADPG